MRQPQFWSPDQLSSFDLGVRLKGNVSADHVVEEDSQRPDGQTVSSVTTELDPLRRRVNTGSIKGIIDLICEIGTRSKVNQFKLVGGDINENVLILDVSVENSFVVTVDNSVNDLLEESFCESF